MDDRKKIKVRLSFEIETDVPPDWDEGMIQFFYTDSSHCLGNDLSTLIERVGTDEDGDIECACDHLRYESFKEADNGK